VKAKTTNVLKTSKAGRPVKRLKDADTEICPVCGKVTIFSLFTLRENYAYSYTRNKKKYYPCSYTCSNKAQSEIPEHKSIKH